MMKIEDIEAQEIQTDRTVGRITEAYLANAKRGQWVDMVVIREDCGASRADFDAAISYLRLYANSIEVNEVTDQIRFVY